MKYVQLQALPVNAETQAHLAASVGVEGCVVFTRDELTAVAVFGPGCDCASLDIALAAHPGTTAAWVRARAVHAPGRTGRALQMLAAQPGLAPYTAAQACGVNVAAVYRALKRQALRGSCACCGQLLPVAK